MEILEAAKKLTGVDWNLRGGVLEQSEDGKPRVTAPTMEQIQDCIKNDPEAYREKRRREYPSLTDQLDAIWKGGEDMETMRSIIQAIKDKYPKP